MSAKSATSTINELLRECAEFIQPFNRAAPLLDRIEAALATPPQEPSVQKPVAWIVGNGDGTKWRKWTSGNPTWTDSRDLATRYARRIDAEAVHAEDEDAWTVEPYADATTHDWFEYKGMECCQKCGNVRNETSDSRPCKGSPSVGTRDASPSPAGDRSVKALRDALEKCVAYISSPVRMSRDEDETARRSAIIQDARSALSTEGPDQ